MKFIQTSDIHVGECRSLPGYLERHIKILDDILDLAIKHQVPLIIPGDLHHRVDTTYEERHAISNWFAKISNSGTQTIITHGNHDHVDGEFTQLDIYKPLNLPSISIITWNPEVRFIDNTGFICLGWKNYTGPEIEKEVRRLLPLVQHCKYKVVLLHECLIGAKFDNGRASPKGPRLPNVPEITYWAIGDLHSMQNIALPNAYYAGAPAQFRFDDNPRRGCLLVDLENPTNPTFIPITSKPLKTVTKVDDIKEDAYYKVIGDFDEVLKARRLGQVAKTEWVRPEHKALSGLKFGLTDGLAEFLAERSITPEEQKTALEWVGGLYPDSQPISAQ